MRITRLILVNFVNIYTGMKLKKLDLDLTKSRNRIILLIGKNGSGKTSILSNLHPFAYPGTMDVRNNTDMILKDHDGYKEIHIIDDGNDYLIKHFYTRTKDSRAVKSFISKNGTELNPNGNVTSFKELIELELGLEQDFLKLLRLGSNVTSFISMKSTERKKFTSSLLSDVDIFSGFYKKVNDDSRVLKNMIKTSSEKLRRLGIDDQKTTALSLTRMTKNLSSLSDRKNDITMEMGKIKGNMESLYSNTLSELKLEISNIESNIKTVEKEKRNLERALESINVDPNKNIEKERIRLDKELSNLKTQEAIIVSELTLYLNELDNLYSQKETKEENLKYIDSESHIQKLEEMERIIQEEIDELKRELKDFNIDTAISKEESLTILNSLKDIREIILEIFSLDQRGEIKAFFSYAKGNVKSIVRKKIEIIDKNMLSINMQLNQEINEYGKNELLVLYQLCEHDDCPYIKYYNNTSGEVVTKRDELKKRLSKLDTERTYYSNISGIDDLMATISYILKHIHDVVQRSPFKVDYTLIAECLNNKTTDPITNMNWTISNYISQVECYNEIKEKMIKSEDISKEIEMLKRNSKSLNILKEDISSILNRINDVTSVIAERKASKEDIISKKDEISDAIKDIENFMDIRHQVEVKQSELLSLNQALETNKSIIGYLAELSTKYDNLNDLFNDTSYEMEELQNQIDDIRMRLREHDSLTNELKVLDEQYDEIEIIKESLSSNKGIPLLFVQLYLRSTRKFVNELLNIVYKGSLEIEKFDVDDKEFSIPYTKDGITADDVIYASQGEQSFISLCLSLALIKQSINKYNILLLDEVDSTLDEESRPLFLTILETYLDEINCEQVFMITHNNAFDNYDIDMIITTPDKKIDNFKKVNILYKR